MLTILAYFLTFVYLTCVVFITIYCLSQFNLLLRFRKSELSLTYDLSSKKEWPFITVQLPIYNERNVVERLLCNIVKLKYPKDKIEFQILDDSSDETLSISKKLVENFQLQGYNIQHLHRANREGFKAGALKYGMESAKGEFIVIFDADFMPKPDFLLCTLPYFEDEKIGVVQVRWDHLNQTENILTELQSFQLNVHFTVEQGGRSNAPYFLQFNGTAGIWRKEAIEDAGGWQADTLTEDLDLSYRVQLKGWIIKYLDNITAPAELPTEIDGLKSQQHRWMKGGAETAKKILPAVWSSSISVSKKIQATIHLLSSSFYLAVFLLGFVSLPLLVIVDYASLDNAFLKYLIGSLPFVMITYFYANVIIAWPKENMVKRLIKFFIIFPLFICVSMGLSLHNSLAVVQGWMGKKSPFVRTPKRGDQKSFLNYRIESLTFVTLLEGLIFCYYFIGVSLALVFDNYSFLLFHIMLLIGYGTIFFLSLFSSKK